MPSSTARFNGSVHKLVAVPSLDEGEARFDASKDVALDRFLLRLPLVCSTTQAISLNTPLILSRYLFPFHTLLPLIDHLCERLALLLLPLPRDMHRLDHLLSNSGSVSFMLIVNLCLCRLEQLLELGNLVLEKLRHILSRGLLNLKGLGELEHVPKFAGEGSKMVHDVLWDVRFWLRPRMIVVIVVVELCERRVGGSLLTDCVAKLVVIPAHEQVTVPLLLDSGEAGSNAGEDTIFAGGWWIEEKRVTCPITGVSRR